MQYENPRRQSLHSKVLTCPLFLPKVFTSGENVVTVHLFNNRGQVGSWVQVKVLVLFTEPDCCIGAEIVLEDGQAVTLWAAHCRRSPAKVCRNA